MGRGHLVQDVPEIPLVIASSTFAEGKIFKTSAAVDLLKTIGAAPDVERAKNSRKIRAGKGKMRGRRHTQRRGPLIVYHPEIDGSEIALACRNLPGVETCSVLALNLLLLAPGGHLGRFVIWTSGAFEALDKIYGTYTEPSELKKDFMLPSNVVSNADIGRLINSNEIQAVLRPAKESKTRRSAVQKKNPLKNKQVMLRLNPYAKAFSEQKLGQLKVDSGDKKPVAPEFADVLMED